MLFFCRGWTRRKILAHFDGWYRYGSAIDCEVFIVANWCVYPENVLDKT